MLIILQCHVMTFISTGSLIVVNVREHIFSQETVSARKYL